MKIRTRLWHEVPAEGAECKWCHAPAAAYVRWWPERWPWRFVRWLRMGSTEDAGGWYCERHKQWALVLLKEGVYGVPPT